MSPRTLSLAGSSSSRQRLPKVAPECRPTHARRFVLLIPALVLALGASAFSADAKPELEFQPSCVNLTVGIGQQATALVVVHNSTAGTLRDVHVSYLPRPSLDVQPPSPLTLPVLAPHADYVWTLAIKPIHGLPVPSTPKPASVTGTASSPPGATALAGPPGPPETHIDESLDFLLEYKTVVDGREETQVVLKSLPVKTQDLGDLDKVLDVQIKTALETLESSESGSIYLVLKNNSARTINITSILPVARGQVFCPTGRAVQSSTSPDDDSLPFCFRSQFPAVNLGPYQTVSEELLVRARQRVKAGKYLLVLQIATQSYEGGVPLRRNLVASQTMDVDVLGESAILKVAGIPAFFLLPGTLLLLTISFCWSMENSWWRAPDTDKLPLTYTEPTFWLISVTISLVIAFFLYAGLHRWYFSRYGLADIGWLWFASIVAGAVCYAIWWTYRDERRRRHEAEAQQKQLDEADRTFTERDQPLDALERLRLRQESQVRKRVQIRGEADAAFVLAGSDREESLWVCPAASVTLKGADDQTERDIGNLDNRSKVSDLLTLLRNPGVTVGWTDKPYPGVRHINTKDAVERWLDEDSFVQVE